MNESERVCIVGCGDLGIRLAARLPRSAYQVTGIRRSPRQLPPQLRGPAADYTQPGSLDFLVVQRPAVVIATLVPTAYTDAGYDAGFRRAMANLIAALAEYQPRLVIMVSSTRVYAERDGGWIDEASPLAADEPRAAAIIDAERQLQASGLPAAVVRFGGIYGDPQGRLLDRLAAGRLSAPQPLRFSNRIHRDDAAGFLAHLVNLDAGGLAPVYNGVDDCPAPLQEVESWIAERLGAVELQYAESSGEGSGHKRCRNQRLHDSAYPLCYPDYRQGYGAVIAERLASSA